MAVKPLGFRPPTFALDAEVEWVLLRAFGPLAWSPERPLVGQKLVEAALRLDVAGRIAARQPRALLEREMGELAANRLREQYVGVIAREALLERALELLLQQAERLHVPCILLKYAALSRMGALKVGARTASDVDVLVPQASARPFQAALLRNGYREMGLPESAHQLAPLQDPNGALIELHLHLPGLTLSPKAPFASADGLIAAGLVRPAGNALLPIPAIVTAHAIVHGLVQHARAPHMYSPLKTFSDLADLRQAGHGAFEDAGAFLSASLAADDLASALTLTRALERGDLETAISGRAGNLLRHALASQLDPRYATRLRWRILTHPGPATVHLDPGRLLAGLREAWNRTRSWVTSWRSGS